MQQLTAMRDAPPSDDQRFGLPYWLIIGCEAAFWVVLAAALAIRYLLQRPQLSRIFLWALPAVDLLLLIFTALDLRSGTVATFAHGLATAYVGFTLAFGDVLVTWADQHFAHRFAAGPAPTAAPDRGWVAVRYEFALWLRCIVAWIIALPLLIALIAFIRRRRQDAETRELVPFAFGSIVLWFVFGPLWRLVFFRRSAPS